MYILIYNAYTAHARTHTDCTPIGENNAMVVDREAYSLSAGFALGLVCIGMGEQKGNASLADLCIPSKLYHYMTGTHRKNERVVHG